MLSAIYFGRFDRSMFLLLLPMTLCSLANSQDMFLFSIDDLEWGKSMEGSCFGDLDGLNLISCIQECLVTTRCLSVNYDRGNLICYLNEKYSTSNPQKMIDSDEHVFIDMSSLQNKKITVECAGKTCSFHEKCVISNGSCVPSDCPAPPSFGNALISDSGSLIGNQRYYTCADGYTAKGNRVATCGEDGKWTGINLECISTKEQTTKDTLSDCKSIYNYNKSASDGIYEVSPDGQKKFNVFCDMRGGGWTLIQTREATTKVNFDRPYKEYVNTFGDLRGDHWIGLENIRLLTFANSDLQLDAITMHSDKGHAIFHNFTLGAPREFYKLIVAPVFQTFGALLHISARTFANKNGNYFSTIDQDMDGSVDKHCAKENGAFWHNRCCKLCNVNMSYKNITVAQKGDRDLLILTKVTFKVIRPP